MIGKIFQQGVEQYALICLRRPILVVALVSLALVVLAVITSVTGQLETEAYGGVEWLVKTDLETKRWFGAQKVSTEAISVQRGGPSEDSASSERVRSAQAYPVTFVYSTTEDNVFVPGYLESIRKLENALAADSSYSSFCALEYGEDELDATVANPQCQVPQSVLVPFYGAPVPGSGYAYIEWNQTGIDAVLASLTQNLFLYGGFFDKSFNSSNLSSKWTRSVYYVGLPFPGFRSSSVDFLEQAELAGEALEPIDETIHETIGQKFRFMRTLLSQAGSLPATDSTSSPNLEVLYSHKAVEDKEFEAVVQTDLMWSVLSFSGVFAYSVFHTRSLLVAATGMFCSTLSYPTALLIYRAIFRVAYYDSLNTLVLFIMLGIGADTIFVYFDAFRQSELLPESCESRETRLLYTVRRAASATLVTSMTTALAFLATSLSRLVPIAAFGIFAFTCMVVLYTTSTLLIPPVLVIWDQYFALLPFCVCSKHCPCVDPNKVDELTTTKSVAASHRSQFGQTVEIESASDEEGEEERDPFDRAADTADPIDIELYSRTEQFFGTTYFRWLYKARWVVVVLFITAMGFGVHLAFTIAPPVDVENFFPQSHALTKFVNAMDTRSGPFRLSQRDATTPIDVALGLQPPYLDQKGIARWVADEHGELIFDGKLHSLFTSSSGRNTEGRTLVRREEDGITPQATCWTKDLQEWMSANSRGSFVNIPDDNVTAVLQEFLSERLDLQGDVLFSSDSADDSGTAQNVKVLAALWHFSSTFVEPQSQEKTEGVVTAWNSAVNSLVNEAPQAVDGMYSTGRYAWAFLITQRELVRSALGGMGLSFAMAFLVLNVSTGNLHMAILSTFTVAGIVATSLGLGVVGIMKWPLGISESISVVILIGFSMDYVLHLADAYMKAGGSRAARTKQALLELGVSVLAGANTTNLAGIPLWLGTMLFFNKFAFLINMTIMAALFWSLVFFPAACSIIGPQGKSGSWSHIFSCFRGLINRRKSHPVQPESPTPAAKTGVPDQ